MLDIWKELSACVGKKKKKMQMWWWRVLKFAMYRTRNKSMQRRQKKQACVFNTQTRRQNHARAVDIQNTPDSRILLSTRYCCRGCHFLPMMKTRQSEWNTAEKLIASVAANV